jgi:hypothetical protein
MLLSAVQVGRGLQFGIDRPMIAPDFVNLHSHWLMA